VIQFLQESFTQLTKIKKLKYSNEFMMEEESQRKILMMAIASCSTCVIYLMVLLRFFLQKSVDRDCDGEVTQSPESRRTLISFRGE
jgi:hypothetical protein